MPTNNRDIILARENHHRHNPLITKRQSLDDCVDWSRASENGWSNCLFTAHLRVWLTSSR